MELLFGKLVLPCNRQLTLINLCIVNANAVFTGHLQLRFFNDQLIKCLLQQLLSVGQSGAWLRLFFKSILQTLDFIVGNGLRINDGHYEICRTCFQAGLRRNRLKQAYADKQ